MLAKLPKQGQKKHNKTVRNAVNGIGIASSIPKIYNMKKLISLSFYVIALFVISCSKDGDDDGGGGDSEKMQFITTGTWKYDTAVVRILGSLQPLPPGILASCDKDNIITFKNDGTGTVDEGPTKCESGDPQTTSLTWEFKSNETVLNIPDTLYGRISGDAKIEELTATKFKLSKPIKIKNPIGADSITVDAIIDLKH